MRIIYLLYDGIMGTVFESQVLRYLEGLIQRGYQVSLVAFDSYKQRRSEGYLRMQMHLKKCIKVPIASLVRMPIFGRYSLLIDALRISGILSDWITARHEPTLIHGRTEISAYLALQALAMTGKNVPVIADYRGSARAEYQHYEARTWRKRWMYNSLSKINRHVCTRSDHIIAVSKILANALCRDHCLPLEKSTIVPTCVDIQRFRFAPEIRAEFRSKMNVEDSFVVTYAGSLHRWQYPQGILSAYMRIRKASHRPHFLILTQHTEEMKSIMAQAGIPESERTILHVAHDQVPTYLNVGDLALLIREDNHVNRVACPTKFGEYLACGLPVMITPGIGDTEEIVRDHRVGIILDEGTALQEHLDEIRMDRIELARRCRNAALRHYDLAPHLDRLCSLYHRIATRDAR